jgi:hypothetical protein
MIPSPTLTPPTLEPWQFSYLGLAFGGVAEGAYQLAEAPQGLDQPAYITSNVQKALDHGEWEGVDLSPGRDVTMKQIVCPDGISLDHARQALAGVMVPQTAPSPLYVKTAIGLFACMARPEKHVYAIDTTTLVANATLPVSLFHAADPRLYAQPSKTATVGLPEAAGGTTPPLTPAVTPEGAGVGGVVECANDGPMEMRPQFVIAGPCKNPRIACLSQPGTPELQWNLALNAGDMLTVNVERYTAMLVTAGSTGGSSRRQTLAAGSSWFNFPGSTTSIVEFSTEDSSHVAATLTVNWADAYLAL